MPAEPGGTFRYLRDPVFLIASGTYAVNRVVIKPNLHHYSPFFHGHLDDSLVVPVLLPLHLYFYRRIGLRPDDKPPRFWEVALHIAVWNVFFEWYGPKVMHVGVYDPLDFWSIGIGGVLAWLLWQRRGLFNVIKLKNEGMP